MQKVLIVEDEYILRQGLEISLKREGYQTVGIGRGDQVIDTVRAELPDLLILDIGLPEVNGFDVCVELRKRGWDVPIIMLTARDQEVDRIVGLEIGADDYVVKPFSERELIARVRACLRRSHRSSVLTGFSFDDVEIDFAQRTTRRAGKLLKLTDKEFQLLAYLIRRRGEVVTRNELLDRVWGYDAYPSTRTVDVHVSALRRKIERNPAKPLHIVSIHGEGYKFL